jgi:DNA polymerase I-like protein with 3'-5' exonuclease and polymerase domains
MLKRGGTTSSFNLLTKQELGEYNALDAIVTLELYEKTLSVLEGRGIDWKPDHNIYRYMCELTTLSRIRGVRIYQELLDDHIQLKQQELIDIEENFRGHFQEHIDAIELELWEAEKATYKTKAKRDTVEKPRFNINSPKQLARLFIDKLGIKPQFFTKRGAPTFSSKLLFQWGEGGELLKNRGKASIELAQGESLKALSEPDGRWHVSIKVAGTKSGRMAGGA